MTRALVIKTYGDEAFASEMAKGILHNRAPQDRELHEYLYGTCGNRNRDYYARKSAKAKAMYGDSRPLNAVSRAVLGAWGLAWLFIHVCYEYLRDWNREG